GPVGRSDGLLCVVPESTPCGDRGGGAYRDTVPRQVDGERVAVPVTCKVNLGTAHGEDCDCCGARCWGERVAAMQVVLCDLVPGVCRVFDAERFQQRHRVVTFEDCQCEACPFVQ